MLIQPLYLLMLMGEAESKFISHMAVNLNGAAIVGK